MESLSVFVASSLRLATPLAFAATGEVVSQKAGVLNLSLEGMMLTSAFAGAWGARETGSPALGLLCGVAAAVVFASFQATLSVHVRANQLVVGIGLNILALGATTFLYREAFGGLSREVLPSFQPLNLFGLSELPIVGAALFGQVWLVYAAVALALVTSWVVGNTAIGLSIRAAGESPRALDQAGVSVTGVRFCCVLYAGLCAGLGGAFLSLASISTFTEGMTNGAGYLAVTAVILGRWITLRVCAACLLFGAATALQFLMPALGISVPTAGLVMLPYVLALLAVAGVLGRSRAPAALTLPFTRGAH